MYFDFFNTPLHLQYGAWNVENVLDDRFNVLIKTKSIYSSQFEF